MIFVDSNIPMYVVGADHPNKHAARGMLERSVLADERLVTSAEVFQEILHRYVAIDRRDAIEPAFAALLAITDTVLPVTSGDAIRAKEIVLQTSAVSARDAIHLAVMEREGVTRIMTFDSRFDMWPAVTRVRA